MRSGVFYFLEDLVTHKAWGLGLKQCSRTAAHCSRRRDCQRWVRSSCQGNWTRRRHIFDIPQCQHWALPRAFPRGCGQNSESVALGLICDDISALLGNAGLENVMLEHPRGQVSGLGGKCALSTARTRDRSPSGSPVNLTSLPTERLLAKFRNDGDTLRSLVPTDKGNNSIF